MESLTPEQSCRLAFVKIVLSAIPIYLLFTNCNKCGYRQDKMKFSLARSQRGQWGLLLGGMGESAKAFGTWWLGYPKVGNYGVGFTNDVVVVAWVSKAWSGLEIPSYPHARGMFAISVIINVGSGRNTLFWTDRWLHTYMDAP